MSEEVNVIDMNTVGVEELPSVLSMQFDKLDVLETNVQRAVIMAIEAKKKAENAQVDIGLFKHSKKEAINLLQSASEDLAEGLTTAVEAQKISFEYQTKLTEITKFLFGLGTSNIAMNRSVVRELELKLKGASEEEISDLAKQELKNVIMQLKAQEDVMNKQDKLTSKVKKHQKQLESINKQLGNIEKMDELHDIKITTNIKNISENKKILEKQQKKVLEHDQQIGELKKQDKELDKLITLILENINTQIPLLKENLSKVEVDLSHEINSGDKKLINIIKELKEESLQKDKEVDNKLTDLKDRIDNLDIITSKLCWKIGISVVAVGSLILNILQICGIL